MRSGATETRSAASEKRKVGRPSIRTKENADKICEWIAQGKSLVWITKQNGMPGYTAISIWLAEDEEFAKRYVRAREDQADYLADEILQISDDGTNDTYADDQGNKRVDCDVIARSKLRVDARKWIAAKLKPKKYGEKSEIEHSGAVQTSPIIVNIPSVIAKPRIVEKHHDRRMRGASTS